MAAPIELRSDFDGDELRRIKRASKDGRLARGLRAGGREHRGRVHPAAGHERGVLVAARAPPSASRRAHPFTVEDVSSDRWTTAARRL